MVYIQTQPKAEIARVTIEYNGKMVQAGNLKVSSEIPMSIKSVWNNVKNPELLKFVAKGMIRFNSIDGEFPKEWQTGQTYGAKMRVFGFIPFGGTHYIFVEKMDNENNEISTREWDKIAKVWNHQVVLKDLGHDKTFYEDSIIIYGGWMTGLLTFFAKRFYIHRQKRWQIVAKENLEFGESGPTAN